jgi:hypothetical protein
VEKAGTSVNTTAADTAMRTGDRRDHGCQPSTENSLLLLMLRASMAGREALAHLLDPIPRQRRLNVGNALVAVDVDGIFAPIIFADCGTKLALHELLTAICDRRGHTSCCSKEWDHNAILHRYANIREESVSNRCFVISLIAALRWFL